MSITDHQLKQLLETHLHEVRQVVKDEFNNGTQEYWHQERLREAERQKQATALVKELRQLYNSVEDKTEKSKLLKQIMQISKP